MSDGGLSSAATLEPGFGNAVLDAQACFRTVLDAMSGPGKVLEMPVVPPPPGSMSAAANALALTLLDADTAVWLDAALDTPAVRDHVRFHCGAPLVDVPDRADFAFFGATPEAAVLDRLSIGDELYPESSATAVLVVDALSLEASAGARQLTLRGPGINDARRLFVEGLNDELVARLAQNHALFPQGVDWILVDGGRFCALPRSTEVS